MDKQGLVAPVWSDAGEVPVGNVTYAYGYPIQIQGQEHRKSGRIIWASQPAKRTISFEGIQWPTFDFRVSTAKDALPAAYRTQAKRGPGWCDE